MEYWQAEFCSHVVLIEVESLHFVIIHIVLCRGEIAYIVIKIITDLEKYIQPTGYVGSSGQYGIYDLWLCLNQRNNVYDLACQI